jgi:hypothetical protein
MWRESNLSTTHKKTFVDGIDNCCGVIFRFFTFFATVVTMLPLEDFILVGALSSRYVNAIGLLLEPPHDFLMGVPGQDPNFDTSPYAHPWKMLSEKP